MTPDQFHFIWGLKRGDEFRLTDRIAVQSAATQNPSWRIRFWSPEPPRGDQWKKLNGKVELEWGRVPDNHEFNGHHIGHHQHRADLLRHTLLYALGGMYLDLDTISLVPIPHHWRQYDTVIGVERSVGDKIGLCNAVMASKQFSQFQWQWLNLWQNFTGDDWNEFSVRAPWLLSKVFPRLVLAVETEMLGFDYKSCERYFTTMDSLDGVVVAHLYRTANGRIMDGLTEEKIATGEFIYAHHARQYL